MDDSVILYAWCPASSSLYKYYKDNGRWNVAWYCEDEKIWPECMKGAISKDIITEQDLIDHFSEQGEEFLSEQEAVVWMIR
jgi:hypothetical protein